MLASSFLAGLITFSGLLSTTPLNWSPLLRLASAGRFLTGLSFSGLVQIKHFSFLQGLLACLAFLGLAYACPTISPAGASETKNISYQIKC
jgi:hypothetical protein